MTTRMTITINVGPNDGASQSAERANIKYILARIAQEIGNGTSTSNASVLDASGNAVASYTYSPTSAH
jgi:hypothetical protein